MLPTTMTAAVLHGPGDLRIETRPIPAVEPTDVAVDVEFCGICGTDLHYWDGWTFDAWLPNYDQPWVPGHEFTGKVAAVGSAVPDLSVGDCVVGGMYAGPDGRSYPIASTFWTFASCAAEVEVDTETGTVRVVKAAASATTGTAVNPHSIETQLEGGIGQEIGPTLFEQLVWDDGGQLVNAALLDYPLPTMETMPEYAPRFVDHPFEGGPFGAKGMGEIGSVVVPGAVVNAVYDATGVLFHEIPLTPHKIIEGLEGQA